jgi:hypothetical protein
MARITMAGRTSAETSDPSVYAPIASNDRIPARHSARVPASRPLLTRDTSRSAAGCGSGRRTSALRILKIEAFAPIPSASVRIATTANAG